MPGPDVSRPFDWVDAFTDQIFGGNGCAVVHDAGSLDAAVCTAFVRETGLVECTFCEPSEVADLRVRYFLAERELPFAGHPTVATVASMVDRGMAARGSAITLETGAGVIPIRIGEGDHPPITMTQNAPDFGPVVDAALVAAVVGLPADAIVHPPQVVSTGLPICITVLRDQAALEAARLDVAALERFRAALALPDTDVMEPFLVTLSGATPAGDTFARLLLAPPNPPEDPFTGSATGAMAAYLWHHGLIASPSFVAEQGHAMGRPGRADVTIDGPADAITAVHVAGQGRIVMRGTVDL